MTTPAWSTLRAVLECLYFLSGTAIAIAAFVGLKQLGITREIARTNARRESLKFAAERCQYFAERTVFAHKEMVSQYHALKLTFLTGPKTVQVSNGVISTQSLDLRVMDVEFPKIRTEVTNFLNYWEAFSIPFVANVADDDLGFQETAVGFCGMSSDAIPLVFQMRRIGSGQFESGVRLYERWSKRLAANAAASAIKPLQEIVNSASKEKIKPIGT